MHPFFSTKEVAVQIACVLHSGGTQWVTCH